MLSREKMIDRCSTNRSRRELYELLVVALLRHFFVGQSRPDSGLQLIVEALEERRQR